MIEFYPQIKLVHVAAVLLSGGLFLLRAMGTLVAHRWPMAAPVRYLSYTVDTVLLTAALMLMSVLKQYPFVHPWLTVKVILIVVYIVLGSFALKRARSRKARLVFSILAVLTFIVILSIARRHDPLGPVRWLLG